MPRYAGIRTTFVQLDPTVQETTPTGALFVDSSNSNQFTTKPVDVNAPPATVATAVNYFLKGVISGAAYGAQVPLSKLPNGKAVAADADTNASDHIGYSVDASTGADQAHSVILIGPNLPNALVGMGFTPGDIIYLDKVAGQYINDTSGFGPSDNIVQLGIADCGDGLASATATDLISNNQPVSL